MSIQVTELFYPCLVDVQIRSSSKLIISPPCIFCQVWANKLNQTSKSNRWKDQRCQPPCLALKNPSLSSYTSILKTSRLNCFFGRSMNQSVSSQPKEAELETKVSSVFYYTSNHTLLRNMPEFPKACGWLLIKHVLAQKLKQWVHSKNSLTVFVS